MQDQHTKLLHVITQECIKRDKKEGWCSGRLPIMLEALEFAEKHPEGLTIGINKAFCGTLRNKLLRTIGVDPKSIAESTSWTRD